MFINKVEDYLTEHNKPAAKSFYDQMLSNQLKQKEKEDQLKLEKEKLEKQKEEKLTKVVFFLFKKFLLGIKLIYFFLKLGS